MRPSLPAIMLLLTACATSLPDAETDRTVVDSETPAMTEPATPEPDEAPEPEPEPEPEPVILDSVWQIQDQYLEVDGCNMASWLEGREPGQLEVLGDRDAGIEILHNRGEESCSVDGDTFSCDTRFDEDTSLEDIHAVLMLEMEAVGTLVEGESLIMTTEIVTDCEGLGCIVAALSSGGFPCSSTLVVEAVPVE